MACSLARMERDIARIARRHRDGAAEVDTLRELRDRAHLAYETARLTALLSLDQFELLTNGKGTLTAEGRLIGPDDEGSMAVAAALPSARTHGGSRASATWKYDTRGSSSWSKNGDRSPSVSKTSSSLRGCVCVVNEW